VTLLPRVCFISGDAFATGVNIRTSDLAYWGNDKKSPEAMMPTGPDAVVL
jgi:hypothetical protein